MFIINDLDETHTSRFFAGKFVSESAMLGTVPRVIRYQLPNSWIAYEPALVEKPLLAAKAAILALRALPYQRRLVGDLLEMQLKMEVAGTSRIENASFVGNELDLAIRAQSPEELHTRSQRQANAAMKAYRWVAEQPDDLPISPCLIKDLHRLIVAGCDDEHCEPGGLRRTDQNVTFGSPRHRGVPGGPDCVSAIDRLAQQASTTYRDHDPLIQALALHYHFAAMHPFLDGNGRTARALESLMLKRAGLKDVMFVPMSNFYYDEKDAYVAALSEVRQKRHDLTPFLRFALGGLTKEVSRFTKELRDAVSRELYRGLMNELFVRLESSRTRVIVRRQLELLRLLLDKEEPINFGRFISEARHLYTKHKDRRAAIGRDVFKLQALGAVKLEWDRMPDQGRPLISVDLDWPGTITEAEFFERIKRLPKSKDYSFLTKP